MAEGELWIPEWFESQLIRSAVPTEAPDWMERMLTYTLSTGGKRLRPALVFSLAEDLELDEGEAGDIAIAVELLHNASLIHDDLPSIDNDDFRRGKPTCHRVYGEGRAIVIADVLFFRAFSALSKIEDQRAKARLYTMFSTTATHLGIGELADIEYEGRDVALETVLEMYRLKTGALFGFCLGAPFVMAQEENVADEATEIGYTLGTAYQIYDDIKDVTGTREILGKTPGKDASLGKSTVLKYMDISEAEKMADDLFESAVSRLEALKTWRTAKFLRRMKHILKTK